MVWQSTGSALHITDLRTGSTVVVPVPSNWAPLAETYPPPPASFDPTGQRLVLPLDRADSSGIVTREDLFVVDTMTRTLHVILSEPIPNSTNLLDDTLAGFWDRHGRLWVLAMSPADSYYQLGYWTGVGPLHTVPIARGLPTTLSAPGPS